MSTFPGIYTGWLYGGSGLYAQPVDRQPDPDAKAKEGEPLKRDSYGSYGGITDARYAGWQGKEPPWELGVAAAMWRYSAVQQVLSDIACPILAAPRTLEVRNEDGTEPKTNPRPGPLLEGEQRTPEDRDKDALEKYFEPRWADILSPVKIVVHYGWGLSEVVYGRSPLADLGEWTLPERFPDFQPWDATPLRDKFGRFAGFRPRWGKGDGSDDRTPQYALHFTEGGEHNPLFGYGRSINAVADWWDATNSRENRGRMEGKAAGINMIIKTLSGASWVDDQTGARIVPRDMAQGILNAMTSGGAAVVPSIPFKRQTIEGKPELADVRAVEIEQFDWGETATAIDAALRARDASDVRIVRAYGRKERGLMEGEHGTKAEAGVHKSSDELDGEQIHQRLMRQFSQQTLNTVLVTNRGPAMRDRIYAKAGPLSDDAKAHQRDLVATLAAQPGHEVGMSLDAEELMKKTGTPRKANFVMPRMLDEPAGDEPDDDGPAERPGMNGNGRMAERVA